MRQVQMKLFERENYLNIKTRMISNGIGKIFYLSRNLDNNIRIEFH